MRRYQSIVLVVFFLIAVWLVRSAGPATSVLRWMRIWQPADLSQLEFHEIARFLLDLRVPIPPFLALVELLALKHPPTHAFLVTFGYRTVLVAVFFMALLVARTSRTRLLLSLAASWIFLASTVAIHPGNPQFYDVLSPLFFLIFILALERARSVAAIAKRWVWSAPAGFFLAMTELTRPFVIYILPLLVLCGLLALRCDRRSQWAFLLPIVLLSGGWHAHLWLNFRQTTFSNHVGFNLIRGWSEVSWPELVPEPGIRMWSGGWPNLNTPEHSENSRRLQAAVQHYWLEHPLASARKAISRIASLLSGSSLIRLKHLPESPALMVYAVAVKLAAAWLFLQAAILGGRVIWSRRSWVSLGSSDALVIVFAASSSVFMAIGERGEEARLLITLLPLLATLPRARGDETEPKSVA